MAPCGSPLMITTNSVPLPVSELNASSEIISEDRGEAIAEMRSRTSCGITMRSIASFALSGAARTDAALQRTTSPSNQKMIEPLQRGASLDEPQEETVSKLGLADSLRTSAFSDEP